MNFENKLNELHLERQLKLEDLPQVDLYMDQVIQLFENVYGETLRNESDKVLTKTMINNYSKGKLLFPIKNKKYSNEHLILMSFIYQLKGSLSISDIKTSLDDINDKVIDQDGFPFTALYEKYLSLAMKNVGVFKQNVLKNIDEVENEIKQLEGFHLESIERFLMIASLVHMSNMYRRLAETLIDEIQKEEISV